MIKGEKPNLGFFQHCRVLGMGLWAGWWHVLGISLAGCNGDRPLFFKPAFRESTWFVGKCGCRRFWEGQVVGCAVGVSHHRPRKSEHGRTCSPGASLYVI